jgi:hypothetical protein
VIVYLFCLKNGCVTNLMKMTKYIGCLALLLLSFAILFLPHRAAAEEEKVSVVIAPFTVNAPEGMVYLKGAISDMLSSRVGSGGEIHIVEETGIEKALAGYGGVADSREARQFLAEEVGAEYVISGSLSVIGESVSLDVTVFDMAQAKQTPLAFRGGDLNALIGLVDDLASSTRQLILGVETVTKEEVVERIVVAPAVDVLVPESHERGGFIIKKAAADESTPWTSKRFPRDFKAMEIADLDGDGTEEIIVIDESSLLIYDVMKGELVLKQEIEKGTHFKNFGVAVGDFNGNGTPEVYLSRMRNNHPSSAVLEVKGGTMKTIREGLPWLIRTLERPGRQPLLLGQRFRDADGFYGGVRLLRWESDTVKAHDSLDLPVRVNLYGFILLDIMDNEKEKLLSLDESDRLRLYEKGGDGKWKQVWRSPGYYGGSMNIIELPTSEGSSDTPERINIKGRILAAIDSDGRDMVVINSNEPGGLGRSFKYIRSYKSGEIFGLTWDGTGLTERWRTNAISGYIADFLIGDIDNDGKEEIVIIVVEKLPGFRGKKESFVVAYPLGRKEARLPAQ